MGELFRNVAKSVLGMSDEDLASISPDRQEALERAIQNLGRYRVVAEVTSAKHCAAGLQPGQKYVIHNGRQLSASESTAPLCVGALAFLSDRSGQLLDRFYTGACPTSPMAGFRCHDPGLKLGGLGHVEFLVRVEETS